MNKEVEKDIGIPYTESGAEKNNKKIALRLFIIGLIIGLILCGVGLIKQNNAKKTIEERKQQATVQLQNTLDQARARIAEINEQLPPLKEQYKAKMKESESLKMGDSNWFAKKSQLQRETTEIYSQINTLEAEAFQLENTTFTVNYEPIKPITYLIFYYIGAGIFGLLSLISLIFFLATRKK